MLPNKMFIVALLMLFGLSPVFAQIISQQSEAFGDQLIIGNVGQPPKTINPFLVNYPFEKQIVRLIFGTGLIQQPDRFGQPTSIVSRFVLQNPDKEPFLSWKYVLKRNISFQNGAPLRNSDVKFTFDFLKKHGGHILNRSLDFANLKQVRIVGDLDVEFVLNKKDPTFDQKLSDIPVLSKQYYRDLSVDGYSFLDKARPLGYGPFQLESKNGREVILTSQPHYVFGRAFLDRIVFRFYETEQQMLDDFMQGRLDLIEISDRLTAERLHQVLKNQIKIFPTPRPEKKFYFLQFNVNRYPFRNKSTRAAIRWAIDAREITKRLANGSSKLAYSVVDQSNKLFFRDLAGQVYQPGASMRILFRNGWVVEKNSGILEKNGQPLSFELIYEQGSYLEESIARAIKIHLGELGINVRPRPVIQQKKKRFISENNFSAVINNFSYYEDDLFDALRMFYVDVLKNEGGRENYANPTIDRLFGNRGISDKLEKQVVQRFQIFLHQDAPIIPLYFDTVIVYAVSNRFQSMRISFSRGKIYYHRLSPFENWFVPKALQKYRKN